VNWWLRTAVFPILAGTRRSNFEIRPMKKGPAEGRGQVAGENPRRASKLADSLVNNGCKNVTLLRKRGHFTDYFPPSITRNRRRRSRAVSVGSVGATARTASNNSPIEQIWPAIPSAVPYWSVEVVVAASDVPSADVGGWSCSERRLPQNSVGDWMGWWLVDRDK
jgi:hypothetical protein